MSVMDKSNDVLWDIQKFFCLPEADPLEIGITPIVSRHQPIGFIDDNGVIWVAIETNNGLKRQKL